MLKRLLSRSACVKFGICCASCLWSVAGVVIARGQAVPAQPIATVAGESIYDDQLLATVQGQLMPLRNQEYEIKRKALDELIDQRLLQAEAKKRGFSTEQLLMEAADSKVAQPSDAEVEGYYYALRDRIGRPLGEVRSQVRQSLRESKIQQARQDYLKQLRESGNVVVELSPPRVKVRSDGARTRGHATAPVTIVEFSDYECPYCHQAESTLTAVVAKYGENVSLVYRDFPLRNIHAQAEIAAEASRCALDQGKFWEYHDQLFKTSDLSRDALLNYARATNLNTPQFEACLTEGKHRAEIDKDVEEGRAAGVTGTPTFFINGIVTSGAQQQAAFTRIIDEELSRAKRVETASR